MIFLYISIRFYTFLKSLWSLLRFALDILWAPLAAARRGSELEKTGPAQGLFLLRGDAQSLPFREQLETFKKGFKRYY